MIYHKSFSHEWKEEDIPPFDELMISWNALRPSTGSYQIYVSVKVGHWSPWLLYCSWGSDGQFSYHNTAPCSSVRVFQDTLEILESKKGTGFHIKVVAKENAPINTTDKMHVYTNSGTVLDPHQKLSHASPIHLQVEGLSQMALQHIRHKDLCSPTSTTAVLRYLLKNDRLDPIHFANSVWDGGFDIFGNWVFNVAQASVELGPSWNAWVEKLNGFNDIYAHLQKGIPVVVSVRGPLLGSPFPYATGHLIAVIGYRPENNTVICMDPAFSTNRETHVFYPLEEFQKAWERRGKVAYIFDRV